MMIIRNKKRYQVIMEIGVNVGGGTLTKRIFPVLEGKRIKEIIKTKIYLERPVYELSVVNKSIINVQKGK